MEIQIIKDTVLKPSSEQSNKIPEDQKVKVGKGKRLPIAAYVFEGVHMKFTLDLAKIDPKTLHPSGKNTWFVWEACVNDAEGFRYDSFQIPDNPGKKLGKAFKLPGNVSTFYSNQPIIPGGNFCWYEALHFDANGNYREPANESVVSNIIRVASELEKIRTYLGNEPIRINSWYRDPVTNAMVGGATQSRHMIGDAVDFVHARLSPFAVHQRLDTFWGSKGGLASASSFTHVDCRGYKARWSY